MNKLQKQNVMLFTRTMGLGGTENVVLQLCEILNPVVNKVIVCSCGGVNEGCLDEMGIVHYTIPDIENKKIDTVLKTLKMVKNVINKEHITIVHVHHRMAAFYITLLKKMNNHFSFFATAHNTFEDKVWFTRFAYKNAKVIACGREVSRNLTDYYQLNKDRVVVIHNAVKPYTKPIVQDEYLMKLKSDGAILVGNIGRLSEQKGMIYFVDSYKQAHCKVSNLKYIIVGEGEDEKKLKNRVKLEHNQENIIFLGYRADVQNVMAQMDFIVLSSLWEGFPLTPIEAFSVKKPVIGTAVDGTKEIIDNGVNGYLVAPRDSRLIAEKVIELANDDEKCIVMGQNAHKTYEREFDFATFQKNILSFYEAELE